MCHGPVGTNRIQPPSSIKYDHHNDDDDDGDNDDDDDDEDVDHDEDKEEEDVDDDDSDDDNDNDKADYKHGVGILIDLCTFVAKFFVAIYAIFWQSSDFIAFRMYATAS